ncbi:N-acetyltransferase [Sporolactobacillus sp. THM7-7]|nr:N-acetyltransferase [Sporolactobacillus sp. THM7-7]
MEINEGTNRFFMTDHLGSDIAEVTYTPSGDNVIAIDHTFVAPAYRGRHIARQLIDAVVEKARRENKKIVPVCSYAQVLFARVRDYRDVLYKD